MQILQYKGKQFVFKKDNEESTPKMHTDRIWFIIHNLDKNLHSYDYIVKMSQIWVYQKHYNLTYEPHIMSAIEELIN